jgi:hypothetical protein
MTASEWLSDSPWDVSYARGSADPDTDSFDLEAYQRAAYRRARYAWLYDDEDIWAVEPSLS